MSTHRPDLEYELLSAYIDGELSDSERIALEQRLATDAALRADLDSLRQTVALIQQVAPRKAPRNFSLPAGFSRRATLPFPLTPVFSALSTAAALLLFVFGGYFLLRSNSLALQNQQAALEAPAAAIQFTEVALDNFALTDTLPPASERSQAMTLAMPSPTPLPTQAPPTQLPTPSLAMPSTAEENRDNQGDGSLAQLAPPEDQDGETQSETLGFSLPETADSADDAANLYRAETATALPTATVTPTATDSALAEMSAGASANDPQAGTIISSTATLTPETVALDEAESDVTLQDGQDRPYENAIRQRLQSSPATPFVGLILLALGTLLTLIAAATTLLRRRRQT